METKMWMAPKAGALVSKGSDSRRMILGGRFCLEEQKGMFMGRPFEALKIQGFDNLHGEFFSNWLDSMSTWPSSSRSKRNADGVLEGGGVLYDISTPDGRPFRRVIDEWSEDAMLVDMYDSTRAGTESKTVEMTYERGKE